MKVKGLSIVERQILINQFKILSKFEGDENKHILREENYESKIKILEDGYIFILNRNWFSKIGREN